MSLTQEGSLTAVWHNQGQRTDFGPYTISQEENDQLWGLIEQANLPNLSSSMRMGIPDEVNYTFIVQTETKTFKGWMWASDAIKTKPIYNLLKEIDQLLYHFTEQQLHLQ